MQNLNKNYSFKLQILTRQKLCKSIHVNKMQKCG